MSNSSVAKLNKLSTGMTTFLAAGVLVFAIMSDNGGSENSQRQWDYQS